MKNRDTQPAPEKSAQTRARLLNAFIELLQSKGSGQLSLQEVAQTARMTTGAAQHHFGLKAALMVETIIQLVDQIDRDKDFWPPPHWSPKRRADHFVQQACLQLHSQPRFAVACSTYIGTGWVQQSGPPSVSGPSPVGASLTPTQGGSLVDASGVVWTFGPTQRGADFEVLRNGAANGGFARLMRVAANGAVWVEATGGSWWTFTGSGWVQQSGPPPTATSSPVGASLTPTQGGSLTDASGVVWTFGPNRRGPDAEVLRNGAANGGWGILMRVAGSGAVWVQASDTSWWAFTGSAWVRQSGAP